MVGKQGRGRRNRWKMRQWGGVVWLCGNRWGPHLFISSLICVEMLPGHILWWFTRNCAFVVVGFLYLPVWMILTHFNRVFIAKIGWQWIILFLVLFFFPFLLFSPIFIQILDFHLFAFIFFIFFPFSIHSSFHLRIFLLNSPNEIVDTKDAQNYWKTLYDALFYCSQYQRYTHFHYLVYKPVNNKNTGHFGSMVFPSIQYLNDLCSQMFGNFLLVFHTYALISS